MTNSKINCGKHEFTKLKLGRVVKVTHKYPPESISETYFLKNEKEANNKIKQLKKDYCK